MVQLERGAAVLQSVGIAFSVRFIVGLPGETQASVDKSVALCNGVRPDRVQVTRYTPIRGSPLAVSLGLAASTGFYDHDGEEGKTMSRRG